MRCLRGLFRPKRRRERKPKSSTPDGPRPTQRPLNQALASGTKPPGPTPISGIHSRDSEHSDQALNLNDAVIAVSPASIEEIRKNIWNEAYDLAKNDEPKVAEAYEKILSVQLAVGDLSSFSPPNNDATNDIKQNAEGRQEQMQKLIEKGLGQTESGVRIKENMNKGIQYLNIAADVISLAVKTEPVAATVWAGIVTCLGFIGNATSEPTKNKDGLKYVGSRLAWYWELTRLLLQPDEKNDLITKLQDTLSSRIIDLYKRILLYQMKSVCQYSKHWAAVIGEDLFKANNWQEKVDDIKNAENSLRNDINQHDFQVLKDRLGSIDDTVANIFQTLKDHTNAMQKIDRDEKDNECMKDLYIVDPEDHKDRIEKIKGGLLNDTGRWIFDNQDFQNFRVNKDDRLLWIKGDPGKGKTMLLCEIINELKQRPQNISYFFCQATEDRCRSATSVLRGLIWLLCEKQPSLISLVREKYDTRGGNIFKDPKLALITLGKILGEILKDPNCQNAVFVVDALDECSDSSRSDLIDLILKFSSSYQAKWIVTSRNWPSIEEQMVGQNMRVDLELNEDSIALAVANFVHYKVEKLAADKGYTKETEMAVHETLMSKANNTFLWVALVCEDLAKAKRWEVEDRLKEVPAELEKLYERMLGRISHSATSLYKKILDIVSIVERPVTLSELRVLMPQLKEVDVTDMKDMLKECGSFLTVSEDTVYFVHQSAKDFLVQHTSARDVAGHHRAIFNCSLDAMGALRKNLYDLTSPGVLADEVDLAKPAWWSHLRYSTLYWVKHLEESGQASDNEAVGRFLKEKCLYWVESLAWQRKVKEGIMAIKKLGKILQGHLNKLNKDLERFISLHKSTIESAPLQIYVSALIFTPTDSLVRKLFEKDASSWVVEKPTMKSNWDPYHLCTIDSHTDPVLSVVFSPDSRWLATASKDQTVRVWDVDLIHCTQSFDVGCETGSVAFTADSQSVAVGLQSGEIQFWNVYTGLTGETLPALKPDGSEGEYDSLKWSIDDVLVYGNSLASRSSMGINMWDLTTANRVWGVGGTFWDMSFSSDGRQLASGGGFREPGGGFWELDSEKGALKVWDAADGKCTWSLSFEYVVNWVAFLAGDILASSMVTGPIQVWDVDNRTCTQTIELPGRQPQRILYADAIKTFVWNAGSQISAWDQTTRRPVILQNGSHHVYSLAFCPKRQLLASAEMDCTAKLWDLSEISFLQVPEEVIPEQLAISPDCRWLFTTSYEEKKPGVLWDTTSGIRIRTPDSNGPTEAYFSSDSRCLIESSNTPESYYRTWNVWDLKASCCIETFKDARVDAHTLSQDGRLFAMAYSNSTVQIWQPDKRSIVQTIHRDAERLTLSDSPYHLAMILDSGPIELWDIFLGKCTKRIQKRKYWANKVFLSRDSKWLAIFVPECIEIWDLCAGTHYSTIDFNNLTQSVGFGGSHYSQSLDFSPNGQQIALGLFGGIIVQDMASKGSARGIKMPAVWHRIRYDAKDSSLIYTQSGVLDLELTLLDHQEKGNLAVSATYRGYGTDNDGKWVLRGNQKFLRLPVEYQSEKTYVIGSVIAILPYSRHPVLFRLRE